MVTYNTFSRTWEVTLGIISSDGKGLQIHMITGFTWGRILPSTVPGKHYQVLELSGFLWASAWQLKCCCLTATTPDVFPCIRRWGTSKHFGNPVAMYVSLLQKQKRVPAWWFMPVIPALGRLRQKNHSLKVSLDYTVRYRPASARVRPCLKINP